MWRLNLAVNLLLLYDVIAEEKWFPWKPDCSCWVVPERRSACDYYDRNMEREKCELLGCCYENGDNEGVMTRPRCFRPTGFCPPASCQVSPSERVECPVIRRTREACFEAGCCFNQATRPHCYQSRNGNQVNPYVYVTGDKLFHSALTIIGPSSSRDINFGPNRLRVTCPNRTLAQPCGQNIRTISNCVRMGCCWNPSSSGRCWKARYFIRDMPTDQNQVTTTSAAPTTAPSPRWSEWSDWSKCSNKSICAVGKQKRKRYCIKPSGSTGNCSGSDSESQACGGCNPSWGKWGAYGACSSAEPNCLIGKKVAVRSCFDENGQILPVGTCTGGSSASSKSKNCNTYLCSSFSAWSSATCSAPCGGGTQVQTRQCVKPPRGILFPQCLSRTVTCNTVACSKASDKNLDLLLMMDSTAALDDCFGKSRQVGSNFPFLAGDPLLTPTNFPNFFQQNKFVKSFLLLWNDVTLTSTRVAIAQLSQNCNPMTSTGYHVHKYLDTEYNSAMLDLTMSYFCENDPSFAQFPCGVRVLATANRPNVPDVIIAFVPDITLYGNHIIDFYRNNIHFISVLTYPATLFTVSAADHSSMTKNDSAQNELYGVLVAQPYLQKILGNNL